LCRRGDPTLWEDPTLRPDELKIYPTALLEHTKLYDLWAEGEYTPYAEEDLIELMIACKQLVQPYCRINRLMRDIPAPYIVAGTTKSNLRQIVQQRMEARGLECECIRCREVRKREPASLETAELRPVTYETDVTIEHFLQYVTSGDKLAGFLRLSLPKQNNDFDYRLIQDVRLVVHYEAQYDAALAKQVSERDPRPGELVNARDFELRREFPEAWYSLLDNGSATVRIEESRLPRRQTAFSIEDFSVAVFAAGDASPAGLTLTVTPPGQSALSATTDDSGLVAGDDTNLSGAVGADLVGEWSLEVAVSEDSDLRASDGGLDADTLEDVAFLTEYAFEWVS